MITFAPCLAFTLREEGGYTVDSGGPTMLGVTQSTLSAYLGHEATIDQVRALTPAAVRPLYGLLYWNPMRGDDLPAGVDLMVFDEGVAAMPALDFSSPVRTATP